MPRRSVHTEKRVSVLRRTWADVHLQVPLQSPTATQYTNVCTRVSSFMSPRVLTTRGITWTHQSWSMPPLPAAPAVPGLGCTKPSFSVLEFAVWDLPAGLPGPGRAGPAGLQQPEPQKARCGPQPCKWQPASRSLCKPGSATNTPHPMGLCLQDRCAPWVCPCGCGCHGAHPARSEAGRAKPSGGSPGVTRGA